MLACGLLIISQSHAQYMLGMSQAHARQFPDLLKHVSESFEGFVSVSMVTLVCASARLGKRRFAQSLVTCEMVMHLTHTAGCI